MPSKIKQGICDNAWIFDERPQKASTVLEHVAPLLKEHTTIITEGGVSYPKCFDKQSSAVKAAQSLPW